MIKSFDPITVIIAEMNDEDQIAQLECQIAELEKLNDVLERILNEEIVRIILSVFSKYNGPITVK